MGSEPRAQLPRNTDMLKLPRWAAVASAARSARRLQPLFSTNWSTAPLEHVQAIERAISVAETSATYGTVDASAISTRHAAMAAYRAVIDALIDGHAQMNASNAASLAVSAASMALHATDKEAPDLRVAIAERLDAENDLKPVPSAYIAGEFTGVVIPAVWRDYDLLLTLSKELKWTDDSPVDPDMLGPLWPRGKPEGWPEDPPRDDTVGGMMIRFEVPDGVSDEDAFRTMEEYVQRLNSLHRAIGGKGLRISPPADVFQPARSHEGVGS